MELNQILTQLLTAAGPSGQEEGAAQAAARYLSDYAEVTTDSMGSVMGHVGDKNAPRHLLLDAHLDQIGLIVTGITDKGFVLFDKVGGIDRRVLLGHEVTIFGREELFGVVSCMPPHLVKDEERKNLPDFHELSIDIGLTGERAKELVTPGDRILLKSVPKFMENNTLVSAALDNRASVAAILYALDLIGSNCPPDTQITALFSVQEETGERGAVTGAYAIAPTQAISIDVGFGYTPDARREKCGDAGKGPMIGFAPVLSVTMCQRLKALAEAENIPWQYDIMGDLTGTNADVISVSRRGVPTALVSIPLKYMHTTVEMVNTKDIEDTGRLLAAYVLKG